MTRRHLKALGCAAGRSVGVLLVAGSLFPAPAVAQQPTTSRVSLSSTGAQANADSDNGAISADGRLVVFASGATNLVPGDTNGVTDVFLHDRLAGETRRISVGAGGVQADGDSFDAVVSADGRYVAFGSIATNLVASPTSGGPQLFLYERATATVRLAAKRPAPYLFVVRAPAISADGGRIAFGAFTATHSFAILVVDTATGAVRNVTRTAGGIPANGASLGPDISADGRWVAFTTGSTNLAPPDTNGYSDVVARDLDSGQFVRVSVGAGGAEANSHSAEPSLSADGCVIAFLSSATNLVAASTAGARAYVRDRCAAETEIAGISNGGAQGDTGVPDISDDGCLTAFTAGAIVSPAPTSGAAAALRDGCAGLTSRLDLATTGDPGNGNVGSVGVSSPVTLSATGRYAVFASRATNLVPGDSNGRYHVFVRDRGTNTRPLAELTLSQDGRRVTADATASRDPDGPTVSGALAFGDGSAEVSGLHGVHEYGRSGTFTVTVTITDSDGATTSRAAAVTIPDPPRAPAPLGDPPAGGPARPGPEPDLLVLDRVTLSRASFAVLPAGRRPGGVRGAQLALRLSEPATVELGFERALAGRRVGRRCVTGRRRGRRCTRHVASGTLKRSLPAGRSTIALSGRIGGRALAHGRHRLRVRARAADGRSSRTRTLSLTIVRAR